MENDTYTALLKNGAIHRLFTNILSTGGHLQMVIEKLECSTYTVSKSMYPTLATKSLADDWDSVCLGALSSIFCRCHCCYIYLYSSYMGLTISHKVNISICRRMDS